MATHPSYTDPTWQVVSTGDRNGDGDDDILWQNVNDQSLVLWTQVGATTTSAGSLPSEAGYNVVATGDLDGDGKADYLMEPSSGGARKVLLSSTGTIQQYSAGTANWQVRDTTDVSNDNKDDVIWYDTDTQKVWVGVMDGTSQTDFATFASGYAASDSLLSAHDGTAKDSFSALWYDDSAGQYDLVTYSGGSKTADGSFYINAFRSYDGSGDFDGDGNIDHAFIDVSANYTSGSASVVFTESNAVSGQFDFWSYQSTFGTRVSFQDGGDFDGDGTYELMAVDQLSGERTLYNVVGGTAFGDLMAGSDQADAMDGGDGIDVINAGGGNDLVDGGSGDDWLDAGDGDDFLLDGIGSDHLFGGAGNDEFADEVIGFNVDYVSGGAGDDRINTYDDIIDAGDGDDRIESVGGVQRGGAGNDTIHTKGDQSVLDGGAGDDALIGEGANQRYMFGGPGDDFIEGGEGSDTLWGGDGSDVLYGTALSGNGGSFADTIYGGAGRDFFMLGDHASKFYTGASSAFAVIKDYLADNSSTDGDHLVLNGSTTDYSFVYTGTSIAVMLAGTSDWVAELTTNNTIAEVQASALYVN